MKYSKKHIPMYFILISLIAAALTGVWFYVENRSEISFENQGEEAFSRREYQKAAAIWKSALKHDPENVHLHIRLGEAFWRLAKWKKAEKNLTFALTFRPEYCKLRIELSHILLLEGDINSARNQAVKLSAISPESPETHVLWGDINMLENKIRKALPEYRKALSLSSGETRYLLKLSACLTALKKNHEAAIYFNMARDKKNQSVDDLILFADYYSHINDNIRAEAALLQAVRLEPESINIGMHLADLYVSTEQFGKALPFLKKILKTDPGNPTVQKAMADVYISLNQFRKAGKFIKILKENKSEKDFEFELLQGKFWLYQGKTAFAATHLKSAVDMAPGLTMGYYYLALAYLTSGQKNLAENSLKSVLMLAPHHPDTTLLMAGILYRKKRYLISIKYLERLIRIEPENTEAHLLKGLNLLKLGASRKAVRSIMAALSMDPVNPSIWYYLGLAFEQSGKNARALRAYARALTLNPRLTDAGYHYSGMLISTKGKKALSTLNRLLKGKEKTRALYYASAMAARAQGKNKQAAAFLIKAMKLQRKVPYYLVGTIAGVQTAGGRPGEARKTLEDYALHYPGHGEAWIGLADYYRKVGLLNQARETMEKAKKRLPDSPVILANLAWIYLESGVKTSLALDLARQAYEQRPDDPGIADTLGWAYYKRGYYVQASWIFSEMKKKYPNNLLVLYHGGMSLYKQGKKQMAMEQLQHALILKPGEEQKMDIMAVLTKIRKKEITDTAKSKNLTGTDSFLKPLNLNPPEEDDDLPAPQWKNNL